MGNPAVHYSYHAVIQSESDPDGEEYTLCGRETGKATHSAKSVTCKDCLRRLEKEKKD